MGAAHAHAGPGLTGAFHGVQALVKRPGAHTIFSNSADVIAFAASSVSNSVTFGCASAPQSFPASARTSTSSAFPLRRRGSQPVMRASTRPRACFASTLPAGRKVRARPSPNGYDRANAGRHACTARGRDGESRRLAREKGRAPPTHEHSARRDSPASRRPRRSSQEHCRLRRGVGPRGDAPEATAGVARALSAGLEKSVEEFEATHPRLVEIAGSLSNALANVGL